MDFRSSQGLIRPMMDIPKGLVRDYALAQGIPYVHDRSNDDTRLARNLIRSAVIPVMEKINPRVVNSISSLARIAREEGTALERMSRVLEDSTAVFDWGIIKSFRADDLKVAERALVKRMFIRIISGLPMNPEGSMRSRWTGPWASFGERHVRTPSNGR
jgi:tRNA(Ile)-lysidine synthase